MRWEDREESGNVVDQRGRGVPLAAGGGIGVLVIALVVMLLGGDPSAVLSQAGNVQMSDGGGQVATSAEEESLKKLVGVTLADTERVWTQVFEEQLGREYIKPKLILFTGQTQSGCGLADAGVGPFYCGEDQQVYIDLSFYKILADRFKSAGDFARAYVIAHEVGHHVQKQLSMLDKVHAMRERVSEKDYNRLSVRLELQADFYAGVWAHYDKDMAQITEDDIRDAINAASEIGDDNIQRQSQGTVEPDSFTHGTGEQRVKWFLKGWKSGQIADGDTFSTRDL